MQKHVLTLDNFFRASPVNSQFCKDYLIVKMAGDEDDDDWTYKIVPKSWMVGEVECHYPKDRMTPCALEKMVEKGGKALPRKAYKKVQVKPVHDDGTFSTENMILKLYVQFLKLTCVIVLDNFLNLIDLLSQFQKEPDRMAESIASQQSSLDSQRPVRTKNLSLRSLESLQIPTDSDR